MKYLNSVFTVIALISFSSTSVFAMENFLDKPFKYISKNKVLYKMSKRLLSDKNHQKSVVINVEKSKKNINKILETPIIAKKIPPSYNLPKNFFIEDREDVVLEHVNERILHVHRNLKMEKEFFISEIKKEKEKKNMHRVLLKEEGGKITDRRIKVKDPLSPQYLPICHLHGFYKLNDQDLLAYRGSGFRSSLNHIITAGHNLFIDEELVKKYYERKKLAIPKEKFSFEKERLTMEVIFGYRYENGESKYSYVYQVNGVHCFNKKGRDLGIIKLPDNQREVLDDDIGSLPTMFFPNQPHEYIGKNVTVVGYPGELKEPFLHTHSGPIKEVDPNKFVFYEVDTTQGNSGSPGFPEINDKNVSEQVTPAFLTHTHGLEKHKINAGEGYDQDFYDFMSGHIN
jgi:hypothetical protein